MMKVIHATIAGLLTAAAILPTTAFAEWQFGGGEGSYYAFTTDGGFIEGSYQNGLVLFCPDDGQNYCEIGVTLGGSEAEPRDFVTFTFSDGGSLKLIVETAGNDVVIAATEALIQQIQAQSSVTVSFQTGQSYQFSLTGSSRAIRQARNP